MPRSCKANQMTTKVQSMHSQHQKRENYQWSPSQASDWPRCRIQQALTNESCQMQARTKWMTWTRNPKWSCPMLSCRWMVLLVPTKHAESVKKQFLGFVPTAEKRQSDAHLWDRSKVSCEAQTTAKRFVFISLISKYLHLPFQNQCVAYRQLCRHKT